MKTSTVRRRILASERVPSHLGATFPSVPDFMRAYGRPVTRHEVSDAIDALLALRNREQLTLPQQKIITRLRAGRMDERFFRPFPPKWLASAESPWHEKILKKLLEGRHFSFLQAKENRESFASPEELAKVFRACASHITLEARAERLHCETVQNNLRDQIKRETGRITLEDYIATLDEDEDFDNSSPTQKDIERRAIAKTKVARIETIHKRIINHQKEYEATIGQFLKEREFCIKYAVALEQGNRLGKAIFTKLTKKIIQIRNEQVPTREFGKVLTMDRIQIQLAHRGLLKLFARGKAPVARDPA